MWSLCYTTLQHVCSWMIVKFIFSSPLENLCLHVANGLNSTPLDNISVLSLPEMHSLRHNHVSAIWYMGNSFDYSGHKFKALWDNHHYVQYVSATRPSAWLALKHSLDREI